MNPLRSEIAKLEMKPEVAFIFNRSTFYRYYSDIIYTDIIEEIKKLQFDSFNDAFFVSILRHNQLKNF